jgi:aerobic-type carbon monoxide dehydrogenase small subunit (CoxS/CutS family)
MRRHIQFLRRGAIVRLGDAAPTLTLLDYLRLSERAMGTKEGCAEGDCGACTVVLRRRVGGRLVYSPVNACIVLAGQADGTEVISVDDLAVDGLHPVQQAMVDLHGSQCGFCTPGFVMSLFALFHDHDRGVVTRDEVNDWIAGNFAAAPAIGRSWMPGLRVVPGRGATVSPTRSPRSPARSRASMTASTCSRARRSFRVALFVGANRKQTIYRSKAVGEPPLMLAISVLAAIADAIHSLAPGRPVRLDAPATPESILHAIGAMAQH